MDKKYGILIIGTVILFLCFVGAASAKTWYDPMVVASTHKHEKRRG